MIAITIFVWHLIVDFLIVLGIGGIMARVLRQYLGRQPIRRYSDKQGGHTKHRREWNTRTVPGLRQYPGLRTMFTRDCPTVSYL